MLVEVVVHRRDPLGREAAGIVRPHPIRRFRSPDGIHAGDAHRTLQIASGRLFPQTRSRQSPRAKVILWNSILRLTADFCLTKQGLLVKVPMGGKRAIGLGRPRAAGWRALWLEEKKAPGIAGRSFFTDAV